MPDRPLTECHKSASAAKNGLMNLLNSQSLAMKHQPSSLIIIIASTDILRKIKRANDSMRAPIYYWSAKDRCFASIFVNKK